MSALYAAADIYLTASRWEGFDLPVMEAATRGSPQWPSGSGPTPKSSVTVRPAS